MITLRFINFPLLKLKPRKILVCPLPFSSLCVALCIFFSYGSFVFVCVEVPTINATVSVVAPAAIIPWSGMNFGTKKKPLCGICGQNQKDAYYKGDELQEDVICNGCDVKYKYDADEDGYVRRGMSPLFYFFTASPHLF